MREHGFVVAIAAALALAALSLLYPSTPSYDPWAWIQWGRDIVQLELNTDTGPSWKPLPVMFTTVFAPFGDAAPDLWLVIARAGGILALVMCFRPVQPAGRRRARRQSPAGIVAALGLLLSTYWLRNTMMGYSEGLLIALVLFAIERHVDDHHGQAFALGFGAALLRPEVWPFIGLYGLWLLVARAAAPQARRRAGHRHRVPLARPRVVGLRPAAARRQPRDRGRQRLDRAER